ncbi:hypothetical protein K474DRAFT_1267698 [Panus rudis PR-1116 ss-1]|nr:hypothetical protein K474DRAFT_1267698 [Panus rudis PR-1116 ss-1]
MAPVKTPKASSSQSTSALNKKFKHKGPQKGHKPSQDGKERPQSSLPGVQKIKASIRQARRLLAKEKLAADVRVKTERRLRALEKDLAEAERIRTERTMSKKYHKVKFFERQKVTRKLNRVKRQLENATDKKERKQLKQRLLDLRVDLNYIIHYPRTKKYISLFPPEVRQATKNDSKGKDKEGRPEEEEQTKEEKAKTDAQREEIRTWIREQMEKGQLSNEPELDEHPAPGRQSHDAHSGPNGFNQGREKASQDANGQSMDVVRDDAFFGDDSDEENAVEGSELGDRSMDSDS